MDSNPAAAGSRY